MNETPATARLRRAVRAVILADDDRVLPCRFSFPRPDGYDGMVNDYFLVRTAL